MVFIATYYLKLSDVLTLHYASHYLQETINSYIVHYKLFLIKKYKNIGQLQIVHDTN